MELGVPDPVPALDTPAVAHQLQQGFWNGPQACKEQVRGVKGLGVTGSTSRQPCWQRGGSLPLAQSDLLFLDTLSWGVTTRKSPIRLYGRLVYLWKFVAVFRLF